MIPGSVCGHAGNAFSFGFAEVNLFKCKHGCAMRTPHLSLSACCSNPLDYNTLKMKNLTHKSVAVDGSDIYHKNVFIRVIIFMHVFRLLHEMAINN